MTPLIAALLLAGTLFEVNGAHLYYETYGTGRPVVLLHGGLGTIHTSFAKLIPDLAREHRVIAIEQPGHGHAPDRAGSYSYARQADDTAALLSAIGVTGADLVGFSDGGIIALLLGSRHPALVRKVVASGANVRADGIEAKPLKWMRETTPEEFVVKMSGGGRREAYEAASPDGPAHWKVVAGKVRALWVTDPPFEAAELSRVSAPVLIVVGDRDTIRAEHALEMYRTVPRGQLLVLPETAHDTFNAGAALLNPALIAFLDAPLPVAK